MTSPQPFEPKSLRSQIGKAICDVKELKKQPGDLASLRRIQPDTPDSPAFWKLASSTFAQGELTPWADEALRRWAAFLQALAHIPELMLTEPTARPRFGAGLALAGLSEARLLRLFRAQETLFNEVHAAVHQVAQHGTALNPFDLGLLLLETRTDKAEEARRRIAHDYYRQLHRNQSELSNPSKES